MKWISIIFLTSFACLFSYKHVFAQNEEKVYDFSLDEIMNVAVVTATKSEKKQDEIPAIIEVITREQIKNRGYQNLGQLLNDIADNNSDRSNWGIGEPTNQNVGFGYRFDTGQNILLLFNGQRLNAFLPGNRFGGEEYLLDNIEKIEIIRGPGSAIYGPNAFTAVINIISRSKLDLNEGNSFMVGGEYSPTSLGYIANGSLISAIGSESTISGAFRFGTERGQEIQVENALFGDQVMQDGVNHAIDGDLFFNHKKLNIYSKFTNQERKTFTGFNGVNDSDMDELTLSMYAYSVGADYSFSVSEKFQIKTSAGWHQDNWTEVALIPLFKTNDDVTELIYDEDGFPILDTIQVFRNREGGIVETSFFIDGQGADTRTLDGEVQFTYNYLNKNNIILGVNMINDKVIGAERPTELILDPFMFTSFSIITILPIIGFLT